ncbi:hypothetical protein [Streptomyces laurentii]|uniref:hypothetical protein n=1 Tax=Streptomyces laurentii TaxID=39478 RepID=UPI0036C1A9C6
MRRRVRYRLIAHHGEEQAPAAGRLAVLVEARLRAAGVRVPGASGAGGAPTQ